MDPWIGLGFCDNDYPLCSLSPSLLCHPDHHICPSRSFWAVRRKAFLILLHPTCLFCPWLSTPSPVLCGSCQAVNQSHLLPNPLNPTQTAPPLAPTGPQCVTLLCLELQVSSSLATSV